MTEKHIDRISLLSAYSAGEIGWREACKGLILMDIDELHAELVERGFPLPSEGEEKEVPKRFVDMFRKKD